MLKKLLVAFFLFICTYGYTFATSITIDFETTGGYSVTQGTFNRVTSEKYEGSYSIESGNRTDSSTSCFDIVNNAVRDTDIKFYYKVSSEGNYDFLKFYIDGVEQTKWSGEVPWTQATYSVGPGNHTFRWCYTKDNSVPRGQDRAWVDFIEIVEAAPTVKNSVLNFETAGGYNITTNAVSGDDWQRVTTEKYEGAYSIESQNRTDNTNSCFERTETIPADVIKTLFYYKVSSEGNYDFLIFYIDGVEKNKWAGEIDWTLAQYDVTPGSHTFRWCYKKDNSVSNGQDRAWVDDFGFTTPGTNLISISEVTPVVTPTNTSTPSYVFQSSASGTITYGGSCTSGTTQATTGNNTITFTSLADGTYTNCTIQVGNSNILNIPSFQVDTTNPNISYTTGSPFATHDLIPNTDIPISVDFSDATSGVNTSTASMTIQKWNGTSWGTDISGNYTITTNVTASGATYTVPELGFGKYQFTHSISDNAGNTNQVSKVFYIDEPEMNISRDSLDLGKLTPENLEFSDDEITVTVKTVGAAFNVKLVKTSDFSDGTHVISDWNGTSGVGYDKNPYTGNNNSLVPQVTILSQPKNLNVNGEKNVYTVSVKVGTLISKMQQAGVYDMDLKFDINITY